MMKVTHYYLNSFKCLDILYSNYALMSDLLKFKCILKSTDSKLSKRFRKPEELPQGFETNLTTINLRPTIDTNRQDETSIPPLPEKSFLRESCMADSNRVANYNKSLLQEYWNANVIQQPAWMQLYKYLKQSIFRRAFPALLLYLLLHYLLTLIMIYHCNPSSLENRNSSINLFLFSVIRVLYININSSEVNNVTYFCTHYASMNDHWRVKEHSMTRILTLLVGFYVAFIVRTWWEQIRILPTIDSLCIAMGAFISVDSCVKEDEVVIDVDDKVISLKQFKKDIARYFLLSWTMCMCRISKPLKAAFPGPESYGKKQLLTKKEFDQLTTGIDDDCWLERWSIPFVWVDKLVTSIGKETNARDLKGHVVKGVRFKDAKEIAISLYKFKDQLQGLRNQHQYQIPHLMSQCITFALVFFMFLGVFAGHEMGFHPDDEETCFVKLLKDFPFYYCVKYALLISWLKAAKDLQHPFGADE